MNSPDRSFQSRRLARQSGALLSTGVFTYAGALALNVVLARALGPAGFGGYVVVFSTAMALSSMGLLGGDWILMRHGSYYEGIGDSLRLRKTMQLGLGMSGLGLTVLGAGMALAAAPVAEGVFDTPSLTGSLALGGVLVPLFGMPQAMLYGVRAFKRVREVALISNLLQPALRLVFVAPAMLISASAASAVAALILAQACVVVVASIALSRRLSLRGPTASIPLRELIRFGLPAWGTRLVENLRTQTFPIMLGALGSLPASGVYTASRRVALAPTSVINTLNKVYTPIAGDLHLQERSDELTSLFKNVGKWSFTLAFPLFVFLTVFPRDVLALFGTNFMDASEVLIVLAVAMLFNFGTGPVTSTLIVSGRSRLALIDYVIVVVLEVILGLALIPAIGIMGAAVAKLIGTAVNNLVPLMQVWHKEGIHPYRRDYLKPIVAGVAAGAGAYVAVGIMGVAPGIPSIIVAGAAMFGVYVAVLLALGLSDEDREAIGTLMRPLRRRQRVDDVSMSG